MCCSSVQEHQAAVQSVEAECRATLHKLLPQVPLPSEQVCIPLTASHLTITLTCVNDLD